jgi:hypothetical protein
MSERLGKGALAGRLLLSWRNVFPGQDASQGRSVQEPACASHRSGIHAQRGIPMVLTPARLRRFAMPHRCARAIRLAPRLVPRVLSLSTVLVATTLLFAKGTTDPFRPQQTRHCQPPPEPVNLRPRADRAPGTSSAAACTASVGTWGRQSVPHPEPVCPGRFSVTHACPGRERAVPEHTAGRQTPVCSFLRAASRAQAMRAKEPSVSTVFATS